MSTFEQNLELDRLIKKNHEAIEDYRKFIKGLKDYGLTDCDIDALDNRALELMDYARAFGFAKAVCELQWVK